MCFIIPVAVVGYQKSAGQYFFPVAGLYCRPGNLKTLRGHWITGSEQETAKKLGEIKEGEVRKDHKGEYIQVTGPTSTTSAAAQEAERLLQEKKKS